jgi:hypothetical protein
MAKYNIIRWDGANYITKLLDSTETAAVNNIDTSGALVMTIASRNSNRSCSWNDKYSTNCFRNRTI